MGVQNRQKSHEVGSDAVRLSDIRLRLGRAMRARRQELGLSQEELADRAGLHRTYLADVERGSRNVALFNIERIALALEMPVSALFVRVEEARRGEKNEV